MRPADCKIAYDDFCDCVPLCLQVAIKHSHTSSTPEACQGFYRTLDLPPWPLRGPSHSSPASLRHAKALVLPAERALGPAAAARGEQRSGAGNRVAEQPPRGRCAAAGRSGQQRNSCLRLWLPRHAGCCWCCFLGTASGCGAPTARQRSIPAADGAVQGAA